MYSGMPSGRPSIVHPLTPVLHDTISLHLADGFQLNLLQIFIVWAGVTGKVFKVRGQRSKVIARSPKRPNALLRRRHAFRRRWGEVYMLVGPVQTNVKTIYHTSRCCNVMLQLLARRRLYDNYKTVPLRV